MPKVAFLIAASPNAGFYSQVAVLGLALRAHRWTRWHPAVHLYVGGHGDSGVWQRWCSHLADVEVVRASAQHFAEDGDWAQSDDVFRRPPKDADVLVALDADTLLVGDLEPLLDEVLCSTAVAGVIAHFPFPMHPGQSVREGWTGVAESLGEALPPFSHAHTLMPSHLPAERRTTPFYLNFGAVFFPAAGFEPLADRYLRLRPQLMAPMADPDFSGQVALSLAIHGQGARTLALPLRFNFPNDPLAAELAPGELEQVVIWHYLRTTTFDRQQIFSTAAGYQRFLDLPLDGVDARFRQQVRLLIGARLPF